MKVGLSCCHVVTLVMLLFALACVSPEAELPGEGPPSIVVISIDTLRSDRLPAYGYGGVETPAIDALRRDSVLFERAYSPMPLTLPAHASLLSGLLPPEHGVRDNMGYQLDADRMPLVAERLADLGYATGAAVSSFVLRRDTGIATGFEFFDDDVDLAAGLGAESLERDGYATLESGLAWLRSVSERPFFLFLHLYEPHAPYRPKEPHASRYESTYDGEIATVDGVVGALVDELMSQGLYDRTVIVLTSDHGEGLGDHAEEEHGIFVYRESLQVPLILKLPGLEHAGNTVSTPVGLIDVAPTLLELAGDRELPDMTGLSLLPLALGTAPTRQLYAESYYPYLYFGWREQASLLDERFQYIEGAAPELYDLVADPGQKVNLAERMPEEVAGYRRALSRIDRRWETPDVVDLGTRRQLESLGYVGGIRSDQVGPRPDARTQAHLLELLQEAIRASHAGRSRQAVEMFDQVLAENPGIAFAWEQKGRSLQQMGLLPEAIEAFERALELSGDAPYLALSIAQLLAARRSFDEADAMARAALSWDPVAAYSLMARTALARNRLEDARAHAETAVEADESSSSALVLLAQVEMARGNSEKALALSESALALAGGDSVPSLYLVRANAMLRLNRPNEAEASLRREIEEFPGDARAYMRLAGLLHRTGRSDEVLPLLTHLVARSPSAPAYAAAIQMLLAMGDEESAQRFLAEARMRLPDPARLDRLLHRQQAAE